MENTLKNVKNKSHPSQDRLGKDSERNSTQVSQEPSMSNSFSFKQETIDALKREAEAAAQKAAELTQRRSTLSHEAVPQISTVSSEATPEETLLMMQNTLQMQMKEFKEQLKAHQESQEQQNANLAIAPPEETKTGKGKWLGNIVFYILLTGLFIFIESAVISQSEDTTPRNIAGFSPMIVLSDSMRDVYARDDFILTRAVEPRSLSVGDDITFITEQNRTVTHRIVGIRENHLSTGQRGFETKGVNNTTVDSEIVHARNVVGRVIFSSSTIGHVLGFIRENMLLAFITFVLLLIFLDVLVKYLISLFQVRKEKKKGHIEGKPEKLTRKTKKRKQNLSA